MGGVCGGGRAGRCSGVATTPHLITAPVESCLARDELPVTRPFPKPRLGSASPRLSHVSVVLPRQRVNRSSRRPARLMAKVPVVNASVFPAQTLPPRDETMTCLTAERGHPSAVGSTSQPIYLHAQLWRRAILGPAPVLFAKSAKLQTRGRAGNYWNVFCEELAQLGARGWIASSITVRERAARAEQKQLNLTTINGHPRFY